MRVIVWHGWLLEGSGSNVATARVCEVLRACGHDVVLLCQEPHPERFDWIDASGSLDAAGPSELTHRRDASRAPGRCVVLRPVMGPMLPVFVVDRYEGFDDVKRFVDLSPEELDTYLHVNVEAVEAAVAWHGSEAAIFGHAVPGGAIAHRALGPRRAVVKVHGSDLEYAVRHQDRYRELAREGLATALAVAGPGREVLERTAAFVPEVRELARVVPPGVDVAAFRPRSRVEALLEAADRLERDPTTSRGRRASTDADVARAVRDRDRDLLDALAGTYDQDVPDPAAATRLRNLAATDEPIVGFLGKLIPQKGVELVLAAHRTLRHASSALIVGFGSHREWLAALDTALAGGDQAAIEWLIEESGMHIGRPAMPTGAEAPRDVVFTGRLDHRYAPATLAAMDVQVVPSTIPEAFGMVAAEGAAAGALIMVARHSGLAEVAGALESEVGRPGLFSFELGEGAVDRLAAGVDTLLSLPVETRREIEAALSAFVGREWTWERTAARLLDAATAQR
ncbi:MAG TPA: glycosyltransferase [Actinomycetota bacterium]|nr:glycosyltransferase [Actinomycetota bacterium]